MRKLHEQHPVLFHSAETILATALAVGPIAACAPQSGTSSSESSYANGSSSPTVGRGLHLAPDCAAISVNQSPPGSKVVEFGETLTDSAYAPVSYTYNFDYGHSPDVQGSRDMNYHTYTQPGTYRVTAGFVISAADAADIGRGGTSYGCPPVDVTVTER
jgi:hypothetical protein